MLVFEKKSNLVQKHCQVQFYIFKKKLLIYFKYIKLYMAMFLNYVTFL